MRFLSVLSLLSLLLGSRASSHGLREPASHRLDVRDPVVDVCVSLNADLTITDSLRRPNLVGTINACICVSALPLFVEADAIASAAVKLGGINQVIFVLTRLINDQASQSNCAFPDHSTPACVPGYPDCGFTCTDGFTATYDPPACVCNAPSVVCNGKCQDGGPCASAGVSTEKKKRWVGNGACFERGPEWAACGVYGGRPHAWECVNTAHDLESCGGCTIPLTPYSRIGEDCSAIPGVADVACHHGKCIVYRCLPEFERSHDGHSCVRKYSQFDDMEDVPASAYGLEHVPLGRL